MTQPFNPDKPVQTRDGRKAMIICKIQNTKFPLVAVVTRRDGEEYVDSYTPSGLALEGEIDNNDLINIPEKREGWINLYHQFTSENVSMVHPTKEAADMAASQRTFQPGRIACIHISFTEGEGL